MFPVRVDIHDRVALQGIAHRFHIHPYPIPTGTNTSYPVTMGVLLPWEYIVSVPGIIMQAHHERYYYTTMVRYESISTRIQYPFP